MTGHVTGTANTVVQKNVFGMGVWSLATIGQGKTPQDGGEEKVRIIDTWLKIGNAFFYIISTRACDMTSHRAGSQLKNSHIKFHKFS